MIFGVFACLSYVRDEGVYTTRSAGIISGTGVQLIMDRTG